MLLEHRSGRFLVVGPHGYGYRKADQAVGAWSITSVGGNLVRGGRKVLHIIAEGGGICRGFRFGSGIGVGGAGTYRSGQASWLDKRLSVAVLDAIVLRKGTKDSPGCPRFEIEPPARGHRPQLWTSRVPR